MMDNIYKNILDSLDSYIVMLSEDGAIVYSNRHWDLLVQQLQLPATTNESNNYFKYSAFFQTSDNGFVNECTRSFKYLFENPQAKVSLEHHINIFNLKLWLEVSACIIEVDQKKYILLNHADVSDKKQDQEKIAELTVLDERTGLANQKCFKDFVVNEWQQALRSQSELALFSAQLNKSDIVDSDIIKVAQVFLEHARRASDCAGMLEENHFALVLGVPGSLSYEKVAQSITKKVAALGLYSKNGCPIELNIGMSSTTPTLIDSPKMLFKSSSMALEKAIKSRQPIHCRNPAICMKEFALARS